MRCRTFAARNWKEVLRDPLNIAFGLGFPLVLMLLLSALQANIPVELFAIERLTPGLAAFGFSFISLFSGTLIARDRTSSFLIRLYASPLTAADFILGYILPLLPMAVGQSVICYVFAFLFGLKPTWNILLSLAALLPSAILYTGIGLLAGSLFSDKQVGGVCGALLTNVSAWLSGIWFDLGLVGGAFEKIAYCLPFVHSVEGARAALAGNLAAVMPHIWWVTGYAGIVLLAAIGVFRRKMQAEA